MFFIRRHLIPFCFHTYPLETSYDILHVFDSFPELEPEINAVGSPGVPGVRFIHVFTNKYYNMEICHAFTCAFNCKSAGFMRGGGPR